MNCQCSKLRAASRTITRIYDDALRPLGLKANQYTILIGTSLMGPVSITDLANELSMERTTLTRNLLPLEKDGFIQMQAGHGRVRNILITKAGRAKIDAGKPAWQTAQTLVLEQLGKENVSHLSTALASISYQP
ncbi:MAG: MarR family winged helix-turn-helix transcriptional regulator [Motiliproteus sp.]